ncbi:MFS transporter [Demetria terragena]|uniref:MFS transporter n=1 Tax=Demetria terragena TaxID=63959 RepID=UPI00036D0CAB|nr:MFS transporter [Demetria terragena]
MIPTTSPNTAPTQSPPRRWAGLAVLASSLLVVVMDMTILNVAIPALSADLRPSSLELLWIVDIYSLIIAGLLVTVASLGDRWGRHRMLIAGYSVFGLASTLVLFVDSATGLIAVRALLGLGGAAIMPSTLSMIRGLFPNPRERATALGIWGGTAAVGSALGPIVGGVLLEHFSWHSAFLVNVPIMMAAVVGAVILLPPSRSSRPAPLDPVATVLSMVGMVALVYAIKELGKDGLATAPALLLSVGLVALAAFVRRCLTRPEPMLEIRLFKGRGFTAGVTAAFVTSLAMAAVLLLGAQWLLLVRGFSPVEAGLAMLPAAIGGAIGSPIAPTVASRIGARAVLSGGLALGGIGFLMLFIAPEPLTYSWVAAAFVFVGVAMSSLAVGSAVIMAGAPADKAGSAAAIEETSYEVGAALGVAILGSLGAALYRGHLDPAALAGLPAGTVSDIRESLGGALEVAGGLGNAGDAVTVTAQSAFTSSLTGVGLAGGVVMLVAAVGVWILTPRDLDLSGAHD